MKIIIDSTWIAGQFGTNNINGGYRVIDNFLRQLYKYPQHTFYLTHTTHRKSYTENLIKYHQDLASPKNVIVSAVSFQWLEKRRFLDLYRKLNGIFPISAVLPFINLNILKSADLYYSCIDAIPYIIKKNKKIKKYFTALDLIPIVRPDLSKLFYDYTKSLYDKLTPDVNILAISYNTKKDILKYRPDLNIDKIRITYLGADQKTFYPVYDSIKINKIKTKYEILTQFYILSINSQSVYKNSKFVIEGFCKWAQLTNNIKTSLVLVGRTMNDQNLTLPIIPSHIKNNIIYLTDISDTDLAPLYSGATCFIYLSMYEGFGLPILESMYCGTPVICSNTSSMPEVAGDAAILIDPKDEKQYIESISLAFNNIQISESLKSKGLQRSKMFSWPSYTEQVINAFESSE